MMKDIIDYQKNAVVAVPMDTDDVLMSIGQKCPIKATKGWKLCILWEVGSTSWIPFTDLKESQPIEEVAEFA